MSGIDEFSVNIKQRLHDLMKSKIICNHVRNGQLESGNNSCFCMLVIATITTEMKGHKSKK